MKAHAGLAIMGSYHRKLSSEAMLLRLNGSGGESAIKAILKARYEPLMLGNILGEKGKHKDIPMGVPRGPRSRA